MTFSSLQVLCQACPGSSNRIHLLESWKIEFIDIYKR